MDAYLWPLVSCHLYTTIIRQKKKDFAEIEKIEKYIQKNVNVRIEHNSLCVCACACVCAYVCVWERESERERERVKRNFFMCVSYMQF